MDELEQSIAAAGVRGIWERTGPVSLSQDKRGLTGTALDDLIVARRQWIDEVLRPWCARATHAELKLAEFLWLDLAGRVPPEETLRVWAWERFAGFVDPTEGLSEAREWTFQHRDGRTVTGFIDRRESGCGTLAICTRNPVTGRIETVGPWSVDEVVAIHPSVGDAGANTVPH